MGSVIILLPFSVNGLILVAERFTTPIDPTPFISNPPIVIGSPVIESSSVLIVEAYIVPALAPLKPYKVCVPLIVILPV